MGCRIIPMRVGTSHAATRAVSDRMDHPHACGDKHYTFQKLTECLGSSPCVWGQANAVKISYTAFRIIPMRVGTRSAIRLSVISSMDHPHACGDKVSADMCELKITGSSPCVWGQVNLYVFHVKINRIIPMRVGTSYIVNKKYGGYEDHPHACGDKIGSTHLDGAHSGSSPCVWGQGIGALCHFAI